VQGLRLLPISRVQQTLRQLFALLCISHVWQQKGGSATAIIIISALKAEAMTAGSRSPTASAVAIKLRVPPMYVAQKTLANFDAFAIGIEMYAVMQPRNVPKDAMENACSIDPERRKELITSNLSSRSIIWQTAIGTRWFQTTGVGFRV
jgi:hypothetical protein